MIRRIAAVAREASTAAKGHGHGLPGPPTRRLLCSPPPPALPPAAGTPGVPGSFHKALSSWSRWMTTKAPSEGAEDARSNAGQQDMIPVALQLQDKGSQPILDLDEEDLVDPHVYFKENPILVDLDNEFVSQSSGGSGKKVPDDIRATFHSLLVLVVDFHIDGKALLEALDEGNLLINAKTGKFVLREVPPSSYGLNSEREKCDFDNLHDRIVGYVEGRHGKGSCALLPEDFEDLLTKLKAECLNVKLLYMHPAFLTWLDRVLFRTLSDICVRMPAAHLRSGDLPANLKHKLLKVISSLPYLKDVSGEPTLEAIVSNNEVLNHSQIHREQERKQLDDKKKKNADRKKKKKEAKAAAAAAKAVGGVQQEKGKGYHQGGGLAATSLSGGGRKQGNYRGNNKQGYNQEGGLAATAHSGGGRRAAEPSIRGSSKGRKDKRDFATEAPGGVGTAKTGTSGVGRKAELDQELVNKGFRLIALNRDGFNHLCEIAKRLKKNLSLHKLTEMLHAEFPAYEVRLLDHLEDEGIWYILHMEKIFKVSAKKLQSIIRMDVVRIEKYKKKKGLRSRSEK